MALNYELGGIANWQQKKVHPTLDDKMHLVMDAIIWKTLTVGMGTITKANAEEFFWRVRFLQRFHNEPEIQWNDGRCAYLTLKDVEDHIGLHTNVTTIKDRGKWLATFANEHHPRIDQASSARERADAICREIAAAYAAKNAAKKEEA